MEFQEKFMKEALKEAQKAYDKLEIPVGAVIVKDGKIIARAHNQKETKFDTTKHAEILAIQKASKKLNSWRLIDCEMYVTLEPCPMCTSVAVWAKMKGIIFGASQNDAIEYSNTHPESKLSWRQITVPASYIIEHGTPRLELYENILEDECKKLLDEEYVKTRKKIK